MGEKADMKIGQEVEYMDGEDLCGLGGTVWIGRELFGFGVGAVLIETSGHLNAMAPLLEKLYLNVIAQFKYK